MSNNNKDESLFTIALLIDELKHEDVTLRIRSMTKLTTIANALGVDRTRNELLPFLNESIDDEDEVLLILAEELGNLVKFVGGPKYASVLLIPLESLAAVEESTVREKAIESISNIANQMDENQLNEHIVPLVRSLATRDWFTSRISACSLFAVTYPNVASATKVEFRGLFGVLCRDDTPMVRRAAAAALGKFAQVVEPESVKFELMPLFSTLAQDDQDSVRLLAVNNAVSFAKLVGAEACKSSILPISLALSQDRGWRVRWSVGNAFAELCDALGVDIAQQHLIDAFVSLLRDPEAEVRTAAAQKVSSVAKVFSSNTVVNVLLDPVKELTNDTSELVRSSLASDIMGIAPVIGKDETIKKLLPLFIQLLKDDNPEVRLNIISKLGPVNTLIGVDLLSKSLLPAIVELSDDKQWRIRKAIIEHIPTLAEQLGINFFDQELSQLCMSWLADDVYSIREAAALNLKKLCDVFGKSWGTKNVVPSVVNLKNHENYLVRITCLHASNILINSIEESVVQSTIVPLIISLASDKVANIRFNVAKTIELIYPAIKSNDSSTNDVKKCLDKLLNDKDSDVKYYSTRALSKINNN